MRTAKLLSPSQTRPVQAFGWTAPELFGLPPVPEQPAANCSRRSRVDDMGLIWLLRGRQIVALTATEAIILCRSGATVRYRRPPEAALAEIDKAAPVRIIDAPAIAKQRFGDAPKPALGHRPEDLLTTATAQ
jgi:hypothetical protein